MRQVNLRLSDETYARLKVLADCGFRSMNKEVARLIEEKWQRVQRAEGDTKRVEE